MFRIIVLIFLILWSIFGCTKKQTRDSLWWQENDKLKVLTTIAMIEDLVKEIGDERVDTLSLIKGELDPHSYELVKGDDEKFARADLIFYNGLGLEHGVSLRQNLEGNPRAIAVAEPMREENPELILTVDGQFDPHIWMDIALWMRTIDPIVQALVERDPTHQALYYQRAEELLQRMKVADEKVYATLQAIPSHKRYLVTSHDAFHYFTRHYLAEPQEKNWCIRCRAPEGLAPESQMSVSDVIEIVSHIEAYGIHVLFPESNVSKDSLRKIVQASQEKGCSIRLCPETLFGDSMGNASSYLEMIRHNVEIIARELSYE